MRDATAPLEKRYGFENPFRPDPLSRRALRYLRGGKNLLDAGCGEGADSVFFASKGFAVTAIDSNKTYLRRFRRYLKQNSLPAISVRYGDVVHYPFRRNYYDVISCLLVGCCMKRSEFEILATRLKQTVKQEGIIIMSLRNYLDPEYACYVATEKTIEPNTFRKKDDCCKVKYFIEKERLREVFADFDTLYYYEGLAPDKYKEVAQHGDSYIICRRKKLFSLYQ